MVCITVFHLSRFWYFMQFVSHHVSHSGEKERKKISNKENSHKVILHFSVDIYIHGCNSYSLEDNKKILLRRECIPVGCVPLAHRSYLRISSYPTHAPPGATMHATPGSNHACPPRATTHAPPEQPCIPPRATMHPPQSNHACHHHPKQPRTSPRSNHVCPPLWTE